MLTATLTRLAPGRPEATLAVITITPRSIRRRGAGLRTSAGRFDGHVVIDGDHEPVERDEQHVHVDGWDCERPAVDLLQHVLGLAQLQRRDEVSVDAVVFPRDLAAIALRAIDHQCIEGMTLDEDMEHMVEELRDELARDFAAAA